VRPFNTFGPRQSARAVIPTIITQLLNGITEIKLGDTTPTRDLLFVKDTADGFVAIAKSNRLIGHDCNIATNSEISIRDLAKKIIDQINPSAKIIQDDTRWRPAKSEVFRLYGSNKKISQLADWKPKFNLDQGLQQTIDWYRQKENLKQYKAEIYNL
jgi:nucleoside-diphosphate-sugar epimerase